MGGGGPAGAAQMADAPGQTNAYTASLHTRRIQGLSPAPSEERECVRQAAQGLPANIRPNRPGDTRTEKNRAEKKIVPLAKAPPKPVYHCVFAPHFTPRTLIDAARRTAAHIRREPRNGAAGVGLTLRFFTFAPLKRAARANMANILYQSLHPGVEEVSSGQNRKGPACCARSACLGLPRCRREWACAAMLVLAAPIL